jgi:hypothetical protein
MHELKAGTPVYLAARAFVWGLIQVCPRGSTLVWSQPSAVGIRSRFACSRSSKIRPRAGTRLPPALLVIAN